MNDAHYVCRCRRCLRGFGLRGPDFKWAGRLGKVTWECPICGNVMTESEEQLLQRMGWENSGD